MSARRKLLACDVFRAEIDHVLAARGETPADVDAEWFDMGLHEQPEKLRARLAEALAASAGQGYAAVLLAFGLCSNSTVGLTATDAPLVVARAHDCITVFLGSGAEYHAEHEAEPGTYWFARGFLHRERGPAGFATSGELYSADAREEIHRGFVEKYGEDNADFLMEEWVDAWKRNYKRAVHLAWDANPDVQADRRVVQDMARDNQWRYEERPARLTLLERLFAGDWDEADFLVVRPGERVAATHDARVLAAESAG